MTSKVAQHNVSTVQHMMEHFSIVDTMDPRFQVHSRSDAQILEFITADHRVCFIPPNDSHLVSLSLLQ
jgi:hypothetical protein